MGKDNRTLKYTPNLNGLQNNAMSSETAHANFVPSLQLSTAGNDAFCFLLQHCWTRHAELKVKGEKTETAICLGMAKPTIGISIFGSMLRSLWLCSRCADI